MSIFPTPEDVARDLAAEYARNLGDEARDVIHGGGSDERLELADELIERMGSATRMALTGNPGNGPISSSEMLDIDARLLAEGENPYPFLSMEESRELLRLLRDQGESTPKERERSRYLQRKALEEI